MITEVSIDLDKQSKIFSSRTANKFEGLGTRRLKIYLVSEWYHVVHGQLILYLSITAGQYQRH